MATRSSGLRLCSSSAAGILRDPSPAEAGMNDGEKRNEKRPPVLDHFGILIAVLLLPGIEIEFLNLLPPTHQLVAPVQHALLSGLTQLPSQRRFAEI